MIIKSIFLKISIHPLFYFFLLLSALTGSFRKMILFTSLILVHELGHFLTAYFFKWDVVEIRLYPYGGCSHFQVDLNRSSLEEFFVLIMGPILQIIFTYFLTFYLRDRDILFLISSSKLLLLFNLLPIYPLDGGKLLFLVFSFLFSYYSALKYTFYSSFFFYFVLLFFFLFVYNSVLWLFLFFTLFFRVWEEERKGNYLYEKFLLERYLNQYTFHKKKVVVSPFDMKKGYFHFFSLRGRLLSEDQYLKMYFSKSVI